MYRTYPAVLFLLVLALCPTPAVSQVLIRNDLAGWGWLAMSPSRPVAVSLAYVSGNDQGHLDNELLQLLSGQGVRRLVAQNSFDPAQNQVLAQCTGTDWVPQGAQTVQVVVHAQVSYWDSSRLAPTEIFEVLSVGSVAPEAFTPQVYAQGCARLVVEALTDLGFKEG